MDKNNYLFARFLVLFLACANCMHAYSAVPEYSIVLENHVFTPSELVIPANTKIKLIIENKDDSAEEFDSFDLNRERVIFANSKRSIYVGPLPPGEYVYFGEFHPNSAVGKVIARPTSKLVSENEPSKQEELK